MSVVFAVATNSDAAAIASLRMAASRGLTQQFGAGPWSFATESEGSIQAELRSSMIVFAREAGSVIASARLSTRNPWLRPTDFFTPCARPIFLTAMTVLPNRQRQGIGRRLITEACRVSREMGGEALRLDSYQDPAGAGVFYVKCGFTEVHRGDYNGTPLIWFETLLPAGTSPKA